MWEVGVPNQTDLPFVGLVRYVWSGVVVLKDSIFSIGQRRGVTTKLLAISNCEILIKELSIN